MILQHLRLRHVRLFFEIFFKTLLASPSTKETLSDCARLLKLKATLVINRIHNIHCFQFLAKRSFVIFSSNFETSISGYWEAVIKQSIRTAIVLKFRNGSTSNLLKGWLKIYSQFALLACFIYRRSLAWIGRPPSCLVSLGTLPTPFLLPAPAHSLQHTATDDYLKWNRSILAEQGGFYFYRITLYGIICFIWLPVDLKHKSVWSGK